MQHSVLLLAAASMFLGSVAAAGAAGDVEGDLAEIPVQERSGPACGTYFVPVNLKGDQPGGVSFRVQWIVPNTVILTGVVTRHADHGRKPIRALGVGRNQDRDAQHNDPDLQEGL